MTRKIKNKIDLFIADGRIEESLKYLKEVTSKRKDRSSDAVVLLSQRYRVLKTNTLLGIEKNEGVELSKISLSILDLGSHLDDEGSFVIEERDKTIDSIFLEIKKDKNKSLFNNEELDKKLESLKYRGNSEEEKFDSFGRNIHFGIIGYLVAGLFATWTLYFWNEIREVEEMYFLLIPVIIILVGESLSRLFYAKKSAVKILFKKGKYERVYKRVNKILESKDKIKTMYDLCMYHFMYGVACYNCEKYDLSLEHLLSTIKLINEKDVRIQKKYINRTLLILARIYKDINADYSVLFYKHAIPRIKSYDTVIEYAEFLADSGRKSLELEVLKMGKEFNLSPKDWSRLDVKIKLLE